MNLGLQVENIQRFVKIKSRDNFLIELQDYYPGTTDYKNYWKEVRRRCVEGFWAMDGDEYRWMPGPLFFYVNFWTIVIDEKGPRNGLKVRPDLRDVEWELMYNYEECKGFAGFKEDKEYTCSTYARDKIVPDSYDEAFELIKEFIYKDNGEFKTYITPREYLRKTHKEQYGNPYYGNEKQNLFLLGCRGFGKSYSISSLIAHGFLFDGMEYYTTDESLIPKRTIMVGAAQSDKSAELLNKFRLGIDNLPGSRIIGGRYYPSPISKKSSGSLAAGSKNTFKHEYEKYIGGTKVRAGTKTEVKHGVYTVQNPEAAVGGRFYLSIIEEVGLLSNCLAVHGANESCLRISGERIGVAIYIGTGGNIEKIREPEMIFRSPEYYKCLVFEDTYENNGKIGWFMPYHYSLNQFKDENGNTNLEKAHKWIMEERQRRAKIRVDGKSIDSYIMSNPITPSEMFLSKKGNVFPISELMVRRQELKRNKLYQQLANPVTLLFDKESPHGVSYQIDMDNKLRPLLEWQSNLDNASKKGISIEGAPIIYEKPITVDGYVPEDMYIIGVDTVKVDHTPDRSPSLNSVWVLKGYKYGIEGLGYSEIVAEYTGRPEQGSAHFNPIVEKLARMYNCNQSVFIEVPAGDTLISYFKKKPELLYLLAPKPNMVLTNKGGRASTSIEYGINTGNKILKEKIIAYLAEWLLEERGEVDGKILRNLDLIPSLALVEELIAFNFEDNFDRVMGFAMAVIGLRQKENEVKKEWEYTSNKSSPLTALALNERFFTQ